MLAGKACLLSNSFANNHLMLSLVEVHYVHEGYVCLYVCRAQPQWVFGPIA